MIATAFRNFYWGFLLIMIDFRIGGLEILPDIAGYILLARGLDALSEQNQWFARARGYIWLPLILSVFQLYEKPPGVSGAYVNWGSGWTVLLALAMAISSLLVIYDLFMGIREMASRAGNTSIAGEAESKWSQYLGISIAGLFAFAAAFIPFLGFLYIVGLFVFNLVLTSIIMKLMRRCEYELPGTNNPPDESSPVGID